MGLKDLSRKTLNPFSRLWSPHTCLIPPCFHATALFWRSIIIPFPLLALQTGWDLECAHWSKHWHPIELIWFDTALHVGSSLRLIYKKVVKEYVPKNWDEIRTFFFYIISKPKIPTKSKVDLVVKGLFWGTNIAWITQNYANQMNPM
jgi:hypothetical protein